MSSESVLTQWKELIHKAYKYQIATSTFKISHNWVNFTSIKLGKRETQIIKDSEQGLQNPGEWEQNSIPGNTIN